MNVVLIIISAIVLLILVVRLSFYFRGDIHECPNCHSINAADYFYDHDTYKTYYSKCRKCGHKFNWTKNE